jgi:hypothetical protein
MDSLENMLRKIDQFSQTRQAMQKRLFIRKFIKAIASLLYIKTRKNIVPSSDKCNYRICFAILEQKFQRV